MSSLIVLLNSGCLRNICDERIFRLTTKFLLIYTGALLYLPCHVGNLPNISMFCVNLCLQRGVIIIAVWCKILTQTYSKLVYAKPIIRQTNHIALNPVANSIDWVLNATVSNLNFMWMWMNFKFRIQHINHLFATSNLSKDLTDIVI